MNIQTIIYPHENVWRHNIIYYLDLYLQNKRINTDTSINLRGDKQRANLELDSTDFC